MGTMITLGIGKMELDWGKNNIFKDHSKLFQIDDIKLIPYYYVDSDTDEDITKMKEGYAKKLSSIKKRLDLLGYSLTGVESMYNSYMNELELHEIAFNMPFSLFKEAIYNISVSDFNTVEIEKEHFGYEFDFGEYARKCIMNLPQMKNIFLDVDNEYDLSSFLENLDCYLLIRLLAENPLNADYELHWGFADIIESGWVQKEDILKTLPAEDKILIVTEGSSDSFIIERTIKELYPDIADFFEFVDMEENYPFTGVGNLYNFFLGLVRIKVQNQVIILFDNDIAGIEKHSLALAIDTPSNFLVCKLPYDTELEHIQTCGPSGKNNENINDKAVAIECFLDFKSVSDIPCIRWTTYSKKINAYQGELLAKDKYVRAFKKATLTDLTYDTRKLRKLIDYLILSWLEK
ncbi:hypothetical protein HB911_01480 [Listeria booriae]|uniref:HEPN/Toprim-associated domain-containing protein n=1 Tax=Listeria booriae TaxID=1552123 RepID=UPI001623DFF7|nr:HEPN/Toprim-associated domain-containing protein [Listeria booriae]MBC1557367.1 hypothetical protein [Listeria booriae]